MSGFAPAFRNQLHLSSQQTALLVAMPVLLGSAARLPMGILTDRYGGREVFPALFLTVAFAASLVPRAESFPSLAACALLLGLGGSSFAVGAGFVSRWYPAATQGAALGVFGLGNMGYSFTVFLGPLLAETVGRDAIYYGVAALCLLAAPTFYALARNAPAERATAPPGGLFTLAREPLAWLLAAFYALTFGSFVAFSVYLPTLLRDEFHLSPTEAGWRTAAFVVVATLARPFGGMAADRIGGARLLSAVFLGVIPLGLLLTWTEPLPFTIGVGGCAVLLGLGSGSVFKLVPQLFPKRTATVSGLVGAVGGLGGFFPPLVLGFLRDTFGFVWPGFAVFAIFAAALWVANRRVFLTPAAKSLAKAA